MRLISWNCRDLGRPLTAHNLKGITKSHSPKLGFLCETKNQARSVELKLRAAGFSNYFIVNPNETAGGLALGWKEDVTVQNEKSGGNFKLQSVIDAFNSFIDAHSLADLGMVGRPFTWTNRHRGEALIQERLDRVLGGVSWVANYSHATVLRLSETGSDHAPILLDTNPAREKSKKRFKFQERWCSSPEVRQIINEAWKERVEGSAMFVLAQKIKKCHHKLVQWQQISNTNSKRRIEQIQGQIEALRTEGKFGGQELIELERQLEIAFHDEEINRTRRNNIWKLEGDNGEVATTNAGIAEVAESYFRGLFTSNCQANPEPYFTDFEPKVTASMNRRLRRPITIEEVKRATFSIHPQSAPGEDGMTAKFFQNFWDIVNGDVFRAVRSFFL
ncbi:uncharacterized protein [Arachis hypogaea]|uniref:uncharacterized protein n=1 Tax=Arachis hypogaea TaxID=3818 RepID=UPI003B211B8D